MTPRPPTSTLFPYTTLFRSPPFKPCVPVSGTRLTDGLSASDMRRVRIAYRSQQAIESIGKRSEEHTSELQSPVHLVCRLLLEKKKKKQTPHPLTTPQRLVQ